ncbi:MAG: succinylglutamate desuccinylase/aspartoacylase family protein, partial [Kordiimonas sp.]
MIPVTKQKTAYDNGLWEVLEYPLPSSTPGTDRYLLVHRFTGKLPGPGSYFQAGLHGGEHPGILVLHHLIPLLSEACQNGTLKGEVVVVPCANPIGLSQHIHGELLGRFDVYEGGNFNRNYPDVTNDIVDACSEKESVDGEDIKQAIDKALKYRISSETTEVEYLKLLLFSMALKADMVFDLHCDGRSMLHLYAPATHSTTIENLASHLECDVIIAGTDKKSNSFEDTYNIVWGKLREQLNIEPEYGFAVTVELRGRTDVGHEIAKKDAINLQSFLIEQKQIKSTKGTVTLSVPKHVHALKTLHHVKA